MTRRLFEVSGVRRRNGQLATGVIYAVYSNEAGTTLANISATVGGSAIAGSTVTVADIAGLGPSALRFYGPTDDTDTLYLKSTADASLGVQKVEANTDARLDALEAGSGGGIAATVVDAKGDLLAASGADTVVRVAVGANGRVLTADSTATAGVSWAPGTEQVNAKTYLDGDGVTEDAAAVTALEAAAAGKVLYFPDGTYQLALHNHPIDSSYKVGLVVASGTTVVMAPGASIKLAPSQATDGYVVMNREISAGTDQNISFNGVTVDGNAANQTQVHNGFTLIRARNVKYTRCRAFNCRGSAAFGSNERFQFEAQLSSDLTYTDCDAYRTAGSAASGFSANGCTDVRYKGCTAYGMTVANGFTHHASSHVSHVACHSYLNTIHGFNSEVSNDVLYEGCTAGGRATALNVSAGFTAGQSLGNTDSGFGFNGTVGGKLTDCHGHRNGSAGALFAYASQVEIAGGSYVGNVYGASWIQTPVESVHIDSSVRFSGNTTADLNLPSGAISLISAALTAPSVPATTVRLANPFPFPVTVFVAGGTVTAIISDGLTTGMTSGPIPLRTGGIISITHSSAPTWTWLRTGAAAFAPGDLPRLALWLNAGRISQADASAVATWTDASGLGRDAAQATGSKQPIFKTNIKNGQPVVRFDGTDDHLVTAAFSAALTQPTTIVTVAKVSALFFTRHLHDGLVVGNRHLLEATTAVWGIGAGSGPITGGTSDSTTWHVFTAIYNGASSDLRVDGTSVVTGDVGSHTLTGLVLGIAYDRASSPFNGDIAEVLVCNKTLSSAERQAIERYLGAKYAITVA